MYTRLQPEVAIYNAQTGIDEKLYDREISADSKFNVATKSNLFNLSFEDNLINKSASFTVDDKQIGSLRKKENNLQTSLSASFHNYKHQHSWKSGIFGLSDNTANVSSLLALGRELPSLSIITSCDDTPSNSSGTLKRTLLIQRPFGCRSG